MNRWHVGRLPRRLFKDAYRRLLGERPNDPLRAWPATALAGEPALRVLHVGDCGVRRMEHGHDLLGPPGYPDTIARELLRCNVRLAFRHYFCVNFEALPELEFLQSFGNLDGAPDVLLIQIGSAYTRRVILPDTMRVHQLRDELARRAGSSARAFYRVLRPFVRVFGRQSTTYRGVEELERFLSEARRTWPSVNVVLMLPFRRAPGYAPAEAIGEHVERDLLALATIPGVSVFDVNPLLGRDPALRCVTGYNLNARGSELVGEALASWLRERMVDRELASDPVALAT